MKEIKFKIYDKELKEYHIEELQDLSEDDYWYGGDIEVWSVLYDCNHEQERFVALQYTGLKDKNEKEIYEGDILLAPAWFGELKCICIYQQENIVSSIQGFGLYSYDSYFNNYRTLVESDEWDEFEIIGNIYENPELLEDKE